MGASALLRPVGLAWLVWAGIASALGQTEPAAPTSPVLLSGTLEKARASGALTLGYRESSIPFSYLSARGEPIGYSIDLCRMLVDAIGDQIGRTVAVQWRQVTAQSRLDAVASGQVDLECGSTTNNLERQKRVAFSPTIFLSGTKLLVRKDAQVRTFRDLAGKRIAVTAGTTNEKAVRDLLARFKLSADVTVSPDHAASFDLLTRGEVDAFATDDVLLFGLLARNKLQRDYTVTGEFLSYEPYGIVYRKGDFQLARLINDSFRRFAVDRELERRYERWFLQRLPSGESLDLPMSPQLETIFDTLASSTE